MRTTSILESRTRKKKVDSIIIRLWDMTNELYRELPHTLLGFMSCIIHEHIDRAFIYAFLQRWKSNRNTFHVQWILRIFVGASLPTDPMKTTCGLAFGGLIGEPLSELSRTRIFFNGGINASDHLSMCNRTQSLRV